MIVSNEKTKIRFHKFQCYSWGQKDRRKTFPTVSEAKLNFSVWKPQERFTNTVYVKQLLRKNAFFKYAYC